MSGSGGHSGLPLFSLTAFLTFYAVIRAGELAVSARHVRILRAQGGIEYGRGHFPLFVALHTLFPLMVAYEVVGLGARPGSGWAFWLGLLLAGMVLRVVTIRALGVHWTTTVWVVPGMTRIRTGPYRWFRHPNYVAVTIELVSASLMFGAWRTAILASVVNVIALAIRIRVEERALASATGRALG